MQAGNFALRMSLGNFCSSETFSSPLDCCTQCVADIPAEDKAYVCGLQPCPNSFTWDSEGMYLEQFSASANSSCMERLLATVYQVLSSN